MDTLENQGNHLILVPTYFPDVLMLSYLLGKQQVVLEVHGTYQKQTYRTRCRILAANGTVNLSIPIIHDRKNDHWRYKEVHIDHDQPWAKEHLKSIRSAYNSSPFYEFYEDSLHQLYQQIPDRLYDWNVETLKWSFGKLRWDIPLSETTEFAHDQLASKLATAKKKTDPDNFLPYDQVFMERYGFVHNLSFLDLLFNLGPAVTAHLIDQRSHNNMKQHV